MKTLLCLSMLMCLCLTCAPARAGERINPSHFPDKITLKLGDKGVVLGQEGADGKLTGLKLAAPAQGLAPGIDVAFSTQPPVPRMLVVKNNLAKGLYYRAAIRLKGRAGYVETSLIVPIKPGLSSFESWQDSIEEIVLFDFKLSEK